MTLKDLLKKKEKIKEDSTPAVADPPPQDQSPPPFTIMRSDTNTQELIRPPTFASDVDPIPADTSPTSKRFSRLRSVSNVSTSSKTSSKGDKGEKRLSQRLHLRSHSRASSQNSVNVPTDLPEIQDLSIEAGDKEARWEERATILANNNPNARPLSQDGHRSRPITPSSNMQHDTEQTLQADRPNLTRSISSAQGDENIQEAIRLHEAGDLVNSTAMFGRLAEGNAMAQILYGLALRHGWGITPDPPRAIQYLSAAAASSANIESAALSSGMKSGGAAKGELVLAIYELANSFRHGWGVEKDAVAARKYYETAANLGDTDAMNEVARCYEMGNGGKKDRVSRVSFHQYSPKGIAILWREPQLCILRTVNQAQTLDIKPNSPQAFGQGTHHSQTLSSSASFPGHHITLGTDTYTNTDSVSTLQRNTTASLKRTAAKHWATPGKPLLAPFSLIHFIIPSRCFLVKNDPRFEFFHFPSTVNGSPL